MRENALIVEGGGMRGIFSVGVLDAFIKEGFDPFGIFIGVSAGSVSVAGFLADMFQRNLRVYLNYSIRPESISWTRFLRGGHLLDLDWLWDITIREIRLDLKRIFSKGRDFIIPVTSVRTGRPIYLSPNEDTLEDYMKASSSLPLLYRGFQTVDSEPVTDGGISDPIPVGKACEMGARNIMVIRSRPTEYVKSKSDLESLLISTLFRQHAGLRKAVRSRAKTYMKSLDMIRNPPQGINIVEVAPPSSFATSRLTRDRNVLQRDYEASFAVAESAINRWNDRASSCDG